MAQRSRTPARGLLWTLFVIALVMHVLGLYLPGGTGGPSFFEGEDKLGHMAAFAIVVAPALLLGFPTRLVCAIAAAHGALSEIIQHTLVPHRSGEVLDFAADCVGVLVGVLIARWVRLAVRPRGTPPQPRARPRGRRGCQG